MTLLLAQQAAQAAQGVSWIDLHTGHPDLLGAWIMCLLTLSVFSFLYRDNPFYKLAEHVFVGVGTSYYTMQYYEDGVIKPLREYLTQAGTEYARHAVDSSIMMSIGGYQVTPLTAIVVRCVPVLLSIMLLVRLFSRNAWAPRWPLAIMVGVYAALKMTGETQTKLVIQVRDTMQPLVSKTAVPWDQAAKIELTQGFYLFAHLVFLVGLICVLAHFIFTYKRNKLLSGVSRVGIVMLMLTFGAMFGFTVLGRIALLINRVAELKGFSEAPYALVQPAAGAAMDWQHRILTPPCLIALLIVAVLTVTTLSRRRAQPDAG